MNVIFFLKIFFFIVNFLIIFDLIDQLSTNLQTYIRVCDH